VQQAVARVLNPKEKVRTYKSELIYWFALTKALGVSPTAFLKKVLKAVLELKPLSKASPI